jgi:DNA invertase Pin-like site-specific DNA recombinase
MSLNTDNQSRPKAYSYIRMSTDIQLKGDSRRRQLDKSRLYATNHNLDLVETIEDIGLSAFKGQHIESGTFGRFLKLIEEGKIDKGSYLLVENLDRLSREKVLVAFNQFSQIIGKGIVIVTLTDNQIYTEEKLNENMGLLYVSLGVMNRAFDESKTKSDRLSSAWRNKRKKLDKNNIYTRICPAWIEYDEQIKAFKLIKERAEIVKDIIRLSISGCGSFMITKLLNSDPKKYKVFSKKENARWYGSYVLKILNNRSVFGEMQPYKMMEGKRVPEGEPIEDYFPAAVTEEDFMLSKSRIAERRISGAGRKGLTFSNIFTRIIKCGVCGATIGYFNKGDTSKSGPAFLQCTAKTEGVKCNNHRWNYDEFEGDFFKYISEINLENIFRSNEEEDVLRNLRDQKDINEQKIIEKDNKFESLIRFIEEGVDEVTRNKLRITCAEINEGKAKLENENGQIDTQINEVLESKKTREKSDYRQDYKEFLNIRNDEEKRLLRQKIHIQIKSIVSEIRIYNNYEVFEWDDFEEVVSDSCKSSLVKDGYNTDKKLKEVLRTKKGRDLIKFHERFYLVKFKNGSSKYVQDGLAIVSELVSEKMVTMNQRATHNPDSDS